MALQVESACPCDQVVGHGQLLLLDRPGRSWDRPLQRSQEVRPDLTPPNEQKRCHGVEAGPPDLTCHYRANRVDRKRRQAAEDEQQPGTDEPTVDPACAQVLQRREQSDDGQVHGRRHQRGDPARHAELDPHRVAVAEAERERQSRDDEHGSGHAPAQRYCRRAGKRGSRRTPTSY